MKDIEIKSMESTLLMPLAILFLQVGLGSVA